MFLNNVFVITATVGQGTITLGAAFSANFTTEEDKAVDGRAYSYVIRQGSDFEEVIGVYTAAGRTLTRALVTRSRIAGTIGTTKLTLAGAATVAFTGLAEYLAPGGVHSDVRLTAASGVPVTETDQTGVTSLYLTPYRSNWLSLFDGVAWRSNRFSEMQLSLDSNAGHSGYHQAAKNFDVFGAISGGVAVVGTGPDWTQGTAGSATARGTAANSTELEIFEGRPVNKIAMTLRNGSNTYAIAARAGHFFGSFRASADGQTTDSALLRLVSNYYNEKPRTLRRTPTAIAAYDYSTFTARLVNADGTHSVGLLNCVSGRLASLLARHSVTTSASTGRSPVTMIGLDSTSVEATDAFHGLHNIHLAEGYVAMTAQFLGHPGLGYHYLAWQERGAGADTQSWLIDPTWSGLQGQTWG